MADEGFKRKLTAILSADVIGCSRLMRDDEEATVRDLSAHRVLVTEIIQQHNGRVIDSPGDNILAEFASVVDAVNGAIKIQQEIKRSNTETPEDRRMEFRIGINLGDVIEEEERIYGDGVNMAARVESLAAGGGIAISGIVYDSIKDKLSLGYHYLGEQDVKNISEPVRVYRLLTEPADAGKMIGEKKSQSKKLIWITSGAIALIILVIGVFAIWNYYFRSSFEPASVEKMAFPLPDKPSIAVLPFDNMSKDPEQEYFADGITDDLITDLSKISDLFVIARISTFQYKGKAVDVKEVSRELSIRYVLEGSVRRAGDQVRINAKLIDAATGGHLWAERYNGQMDDIFSLQDKITQKIVAALAVKLTSVEKENIGSKETNNVEAYDAFLKGWQHYLRWTPEDVASPIRYYKKAIELDPNYYQAYAALALLYDNGAMIDKEWIKALQADYFTGRVKARQYLKMAMKKPTALAYRVASWMDLRRRRHDKALWEIEKAIAISQNDAEVQFGMARILVYTGKPKEALEVIKKVMLLDPNRMADCLKLSGIAHFCMEQHEEAISSFERVLNFNPNYRVEDWLAVTYADFGRHKDAEAAFERYKKKLFGSSEATSIGTFTKLDIQPQVFNHPFRNPENTKRFVEGLIKAGYPEPHRYYEVSEENKLNGEEIRELVFGRTSVGATYSGGTWTIKNGKDGSAFYEGYEMKDTGKNWIEGDQLCDQYKKFLGGLKKCQELYRNPKGTPKGKDEYIWVNDFGMLPCSFLD